MQIQIDVENQLDVFNNILNNTNTLSLPNNWYIGTENHIAFHTLSSFQTNYNRYVEKQLIITKGN